MSNDVSFPATGSRATKSAAALVARQAITSVVSIAGTIVLSRLLKPADFGAYAIALFAVSIGRALGDLGLGAGLVRQVESPSSRQWNTVTTVQLAAVVPLSAILVVGAGQIVEWFHLPVGSTALIRLCSLALPLTALRVPCELRLERRLSVVGLSWLYVISAALFNGIAVAGALISPRAWVFGVAFAAQEIFALVGAMILSRARPGIGFDRSAISQHWRFGLGYQGSTLIALVRDAVGPFGIAKFLSARRLGLFRWAQTYSGYALIGLGALDALYFPLVSKTRESPPLFERAVSAMLSLTNAIVAPITLTQFVLAPTIARYIFGSKWLPAVPCYRILWLGTLLVPAGIVFQNVLYGLGRSTQVLRIHLFWLAELWGVGIPLSRWIGLQGFAVAVVAAQLGVIPLYQWCKQSVRIDMGAAIKPWLGAGLGLLLIAPLLMQYRANNIWGAIGISATCAAATLAGTGIAVRGSIRTAIRLIRT